MWMAFAALAVVPVVQIALLFAQYRLEFAVAPWVKVASLAAALAGGVAWAVVGARSGLSACGRVSAVVVWAACAYVFVSFVPGCVWAPACL